MKTLKYHQELNISSRLGNISLFSKKSPKDSIYSFLHDIFSIFTRIFALLLDEIFAEAISEIPFYQ